MRRLSVLIFLVCLASGAWQSGEELALSKISQVTDLTISDNGELWILSPSGISKIDDNNGDLLLSRQIQSARTLTALGSNIYYIDNNNRLVTSPIDDKKNTVTSALTFSNPLQMTALSLTGTHIVVVLEPNAISFVSSSSLISTLNTHAERLAFIPNADYSDRRIPFYTATGDRIFSWTGGRLQDADTYTGRLIYSTSNNILDFCVDRSGNLYVLLTDSIAVLDETGQYKGKIGVGSLSHGSRILANPLENSLVVFDRLTKSIQVISQTGLQPKELIVLNKNRPNPVDNYTEISFTISEPLYLTITIYNLIGEPVKQIAKDRYMKGTHRVVWRADDASGNLVPNGIYFYRLESNRGVAIKQLIVLR
jgi:hypothetical protein